MNDTDEGRPIDWADAERDAQFRPDEIELMARFCRRGRSPPRGRSSSRSMATRSRGASNSPTASRRPARPCASSTPMRPPS
jgi:hypothetical protein